MTGSRTGDEMRALEVFGLRGRRADFEAVKKAGAEPKPRKIHLDVKPGDEAAAKAFHAYSLAYEVLRAAEERREWQRMKGIDFAKAAGAALLILAIDLACAFIEVGVYSLAIDPGHPQDYPHMAVSAS